MSNIYNTQTPKNVAPPVQQPAPSRVPYAATPTQPKVVTPEGYPIDLHRVYLHESEEDKKARRLTRLFLNKILFWVHFLVAVAGILVFTWLVGLALFFFAFLLSLMGIIANFM